MVGKPGGEGKEGNTATPLRGVTTPVRSAEVILGTAVAEADVVELVAAELDIVALAAAELDIVALAEAELDVAKLVWAKLDVVMLAGACRMS